MAPLSLSVAGAGQARLAERELEDFHSAALRAEVGAGAGPVLTGKETCDCDWA